MTMPNGPVVPASGIRCMLMRGGTSKGAYFLADDLPADPASRDILLLAVMGSPDPRQIDGIGEGWLTELSTEDLRSVLTLSADAVSE